jgi:AcrR family transcriptional regulator
METDKRRAQLVQTGLDLLGQRPYDELSIDDIATAAGISKGLLYHYFPSKKEFTLAVLRAAIDEEIAVTEPDSSLPALEQLEKSLDAFLEYVEHHAPGYSALLRSRGGSDAAVQALVEECRELMVERMLDRIEVALEKPARTWRESPALRSAVQGWIFFVEGAVLRWLDKRDLDRAQLRELLKLALVNAIGSAMQIDRSLDGETLVTDGQVASPASAS